MVGEQLTCAEVTTRGLERDRSWAVRDLTTGQLTSAKQLPALLQCSARPHSNEGIDIMLPDGNVVSTDDASVSASLSEALGKSLKLEPLRPAWDFRHYRFGGLRRAKDLRRLLGLSAEAPLPDLTGMPLSLLLKLAVFATPPGSYFDAFPMHIVTTNALASVSTAAGVSADNARFRANLVICCEDNAPYPEQGWCGATLAIGDVVLEVCSETFRCGMPGHAQVGNQPKAPELVKILRGELSNKLGVYARVLRPGRIELGAPVHLTRLRPSAASRLWRGLAQLVKRAVLAAYVRL
jgi:uncharacterized protein